MSESTDPLAWGTPGGGRLAVGTLGPAAEGATDLRGDLPCAAMCGEVPEGAPGVPSAGLSADPRCGRSARLMQAAWPPYPCRSGLPRALIRICGPSTLSRGRAHPRRSPGRGTDCADSAPTSQSSIAAIFSAIVISADYSGADPGATPSQPGAQPASAADRACEQQCQALSHGERPDPPVEGGRPRSGDGALLCPAQFPGAPEPLAAHNLIGINSN